ncbi:MAG: hypothetical protein H0X24_08105 [Ktedonobacterales bacterium]|nr:hypothetical protein [Ktedonobacterales bacterium]
MTTKPNAKPISRSESLPQLVAALGGSLMVALLYLIMPRELIVGPNWLALAAVIILAVPALSLLLFSESGIEHRLIRPFTLTILSLLTLALITSLALLIHELVVITPGAGLDLLKPAVLLWASNVVIFAIWYWEVDGGGFIGRHHRRHEAADFRFPQQDGGNTTHWVPGYIDYLFLAFSTATAFSPADTVPLTRRAKLLMMGESIGSMVILVMLIARSINIISK